MGFALRIVGGMLIGYGGMGLLLNSNNDHTFNVICLFLGLAVAGFGLFLP